MAAFSVGRPAIISPAKKHTATIIFMHGLGDSGQNLSMLSYSFRMPHVKWVFPTAPTRPITLNGGMSMPGWFDLYGVDRLLQGDVDHDGVAASTSYLNSLVEEELKGGLPPKRIIIGGFSQGGHVAVKYALRTKHALSGCVILSSWTEPIPGQVPSHVKDMSFFIGHGTADQLIPARLAGNTENLLKQKGCTKVTWKMYPNVGHSTCGEELQDVQGFLENLIPDEDVKPPPTKEEIESMSIKQLRMYLASKNISTTGFLEKAEFVNTAKGTLQ